MKIKYSILTKLLAVSLGFMSCDVVDTTPEDLLTDATYWTSISDLELYANGFYGNLGSPNAGGDNQTDIRPTGSLNSIVAGQATVSSASGGWKFETIRKLNHFMGNYDKVVGDEAKIAQYVAEIRFFRAKEYHGKVKTFGDFPWYDKALGTDDTELLYKARDPRNFVVDKIIEDLEFACANLPLPESVAKGRMHKYVAYMELARVCLYEGTRAKYANDATLDSKALIQKAVDAANHVMTNGGYQIVLDAADHVPTSATPLGESLNYHALFNQLTDMSSNKEVILARAFIQNLSMHNLTRQTDESNSGLSKAMMNLYLCRDGKSIANSEMYKGDATLTDELSNRDKRLYQTVSSEFYARSYTGSLGFVSEKFPPVNTRNPSGYNPVKFRHSDPLQIEANQCFTQWILYRYAETLLIYAEGMEELGKFDQSVADMTINKLRERGSVAPLNIASIETDPNWLDYGYSISSSLHEIRRERAIELFCEGFRHDDIYRWRAAKLWSNPLAVYGTTISDEKLALTQYKSTFDVSPEPGGVNTVVHTDGKRYVKLHPSLTGGYSTWEDAFYLRPVPKKELTLNPNLKQTPGWENR